jgi:hypothetical protein
MLSPYRGEHGAGLQESRSIGNRIRPGPSGVVHHPAAFRQSWAIAFMGIPMQADENNKKEHYQGIAEVGSIDFQRRWCVHGTSSEYVLLNELIETTIYAAKHKATHPILSKNLSESEKAILVEFHDRVDELFDEVPWNDPAVSIEELIESSEAMKKIRQAANDCLRKAGVEYSVEELLAD